MRICLNSPLASVAAIAAFCDLRKWPSASIDNGSARNIDACEACRWECHVPWCHGATVPQCHVLCISMECYAFPLPFLLSLLSPSTRTLDRSERMLNTKATSCLRDANSERDGGGGVAGEGMATGQHNIHKLATGSLCSFAFLCIK